jgi:hypothetical protein
MSLFDLPAEIEKLADTEEAIVVVNLEGVVVLASKAAAALWDITVDDMVGEFHELLVPSDRRWGHQAYRRGYFAEPRAREMDPGLDPHLEKPDGTLVPIDIWLTPHTVGGHLYAEAKITVREAGGEPTSASPV